MRVPAGRGREARARRRRTAWCSAPTRRADATSRWCSAATARSSPRCAHYAGPTVPVFAVNYGAIGFLATVEPRRSSTDGHRPRARGRLRRAAAARARGRDRRPGERIAVNDISFHRRQDGARGGAGLPVVGEAARARSAATGWWWPRRRARPATTWPTAGRCWPGAWRATWSRSSRRTRSPRGRWSWRPTMSLEVHNRSARRAGGRQHRRPHRAARWTPASVEVSFAGRRRCWPSSRGELLPPAAREVRPPRSRATRAGVASAPGPSGAAGRPGPVLLELRIENLLLIERAELRPGAGLNVITGETGAGKTVLAHALDLLLGGKPRSGIVRPGAAEAYVEGVFELPAGLLDGAGAGRPARAHRPEDADEIVLAPARRRRGPHARLRAGPLGDRGRPARARRAARGLLRPARAPQAHARLGPARAARRLLRRRAPRAARRVAAAHARVRELERRAGRAARARPARATATSTCCAFELEEIEAVGPTEAEEDGAGRPSASGCASSTRLRAAAGGGAEAIAPEGGEAGVAARCSAQAERAGRRRRGRGSGARCARRAPRRPADRGRRPRRRAAPLPRRARGASPGGSRRWRRGSSCTTACERKHGGSVEAVLAHAERCREERDAARERRGGARGGARRSWRRRARSATRLAAELTAAPARRPRRSWPSAVRGGAGEPGHGGRRVRGRARAARGDRRDRRRARRAHARAEPRRSGRARCARAPRAASCRG